MKPESQLAVAAILKSLDLLTSLALSSQHQTKPFCTGLRPNLDQPVFHSTVQYGRETHLDLGLGPPDHQFAQKKTKKKTSKQKQKNATKRLLQHHHTHITPCGQEEILQLVYRSMYFFPFQQQTDKKQKDQVYFENNKAAFLSVS